MSATQELLRFGLFELNLAIEELRKAGTLVKLPHLPFKLLVLLASHAGQIVTRDEIQAQLWGAETFVDFEQGVNKCIKQIRTALSDNADNPRYIETLPRHGYRFLAPVVSKTVLSPRPRVIESDSSERPRVQALMRSGVGALAPLAEPAVSGYPEAPPNAEVVKTQDPQRIGELQPGVWRARLVSIGVAALLVALTSGGLYWRTHQRPVLTQHAAATLTEKDTIVLADTRRTQGNVYQHHF